MLREMREETDPIVADAAVALQPFPAMQNQRMPQFPLSSDLLVRIFAQIKPDPPSIRCQIDGSPDEDFHSEYISFHRLRLVCKQFKEAFDTDSCNSNHLLLHHRFSSKSLLGLLD